MSLQQGQVNQGQLNAQGERILQSKVINTQQQPVLHPKQQEHHTSVEAVATEQIAVEQKPPIIPAVQPAPMPKVTAERAVGKATVQPFQESADLQQINLAMQKMAEVESEKLSQQAAAHAALQQAGLLMAEAARKEEEARVAAQAAQDECTRSQQQLMKRAHDIKLEREALAQKDKLGAEMEARLAAKAKAEETAAAEAARQAATQAAEADAMLLAAQQKKQESTQTYNTLLQRMEAAKLEAAAATQRAADLTAKSEAHTREAQMVDESLGKSATMMQQIQSQIASVGQPAPTAFVSAPQIATQSVNVVKDQCCKVEKVDTWRAMQTSFIGDRKPGINEFPYILHVRIPRAQLGRIGTTTSTTSNIGTGMQLPPRVLLRFKCGNVEARTDTILDSTLADRWNVEGDIPIRNPSDLVEITLLDASGFESSRLSSFNWESGKVLGRLLLRIDPLVDGHVSKDNKLVLDGIGGVLFAILHMEKWGTSGHGEGSFIWSQNRGISGSTPSFLLQREVLSSGTSRDTTALPARSGVTRV